MRSDEELETHLKAGIAIYNSGEYHAAHGAWERHWLKINKKDEDKLFLQGLIQYTAIIYHGMNRNWKGMEGLIKSSLRYLEKFPQNYQGIDINGIKNYLENIENNMQSFSQKEIPKMTYEGETIEISDLNINSTYIVARVLSDEISDYEEDIIVKAIEHIRENPKDRESRKIENLIIAFAREKSFRVNAYEQIKRRIEIQKEKFEDIEKLFGV
tara:strand:+ start:603 stop:1241 length:639 start_codon:yes stop_codon:yes gene_type:complete